LVAPADLKFGFHCPTVAPAQTPFNPGKVQTAPVPRGGH
jgi:hypothetical protein